MKANELMVGDWLLHETAKYIRVGLPITEKGFEYKGRYVEYYWLKPIPLTPEILKANGFELHEFNGVMCYERPEFIIHHSMRDCIGRNNFTYKYVHQLQHALRLCGLNKLADNFKIV